MKAGAYNVVPKTEAEIFILNYSGNYTVVVFKVAEHSFGGRSC